MASAACLQATLPHWLNSTPPAHAAVLQVDRSLAHLHSRQQRFALLSRRSVFGKPAAAAPAAAAATEPVSAPPTSSAEAGQDAPQEAQSSNAASHPTAMAFDAAVAEQPQVAAGLAAGASPAAAAAAPCTSAAVECTATAAPETSAGFAVGSDVELSDDETPSPGAGSSDAAAALVRQASGGSLSDAAEVQPRPAPAEALGGQHRNPLGQVSTLLRQVDARLSGLAARAQQAAAQQQEQQAAPLAAAAAASWEQAPVSVAPACPHELASQRLAARDAADPPEPASTLAVPAANSSLLVAHKQRLLEAQVGGAGATCKG